MPAPTASSVSSDDDNERDPFTYRYADPAIWTPSMPTIGGAGRGSEQ